MAKAPTNIASGASQRLRWLRASTDLSTIASSPVRIAMTRRLNCVAAAALRDLGGAAAPTSSTGPGCVRSSDDIFGTDTLFSMISHHSFGRQVALAGRATRGALHATAP